MSETTPIRTAKDFVNGFEFTDRTDPHFRGNDLETHQKETIPSYQDFKDNLMIETDEVNLHSAHKYDSDFKSSIKTPSKASPKKLSKADLVLKHNRNSLLNSDRKPVLSSTMKVPKTPMSTKFQNSKIATTVKKSKPQLAKSKTHIQQAGHLTERFLETEFRSKFAKVLQI